MFNGKNNKSNIIIAIRLRPLLPDEKKNFRYKNNINI
jgi:hypothetical protein